MKIIVLPIIIGADERVLKNLAKMLQEWTLKNNQNYPENIITKISYNAVKCTGVLLLLDLQ